MTKPILALAPLSSRYIAALVLGATVLSCTSNSSYGDCCSEDGKSLKVEWRLDGVGCNIPEETPITATLKVEGQASKDISSTVGAPGQIGEVKVPFGKKVTITATVVPPEGADSSAAASIQVSLSSKCPQDEVIGDGGQWSASTHLTAKKPDCAGEAGDSCQENGSLDLAFGLGNATDGTAAGDLWVEEASLIATSFTRSSVRFDQNAKVEVIHDGPAESPQIRQVKSGTALADLVDVPSGYEIRFYFPSQAGVKSGSLYSPVGSPYVTWRVGTPTVSTSAFPQIQITEIRGSQTSYVTYTNSIETPGDVTTSRWTLERNGTGITDTKTTVSDATGTIRTQEVRNGAGVIISRRQEIYNLDAELVEVREGAVGEEIVTTYAYDQATGKQSLLTRSDGYFEKTYFSDPVTELPLTDSIVVKPIGDLTHAQATLSNGHNVVTTSDGHVREYRPVGGVQQLVGGSSISRTEQSSAFTKPDPLNPGGTIPMRLEVTTFQGSIGVTSPFSITSSSAHFAKDEPHPYAGRQAWIMEGDGSSRTYQYEIGNWTAETGAFDVDSAGAALRTSVFDAIRDTNGNRSAVAYVTKKQVSIADNRGNQVTEETHLCIGVVGSDPLLATYTLLSRTIHTFDGYGHVVVSKRDGRIVYRSTWSGDRKVKETDETGMSTLFSNFDVFDRPLTVSRLGVPVSGALPAIPQKDTNFTYDAAGRKLTETTTASGATIALVWTYDSLGRVKTASENGKGTSFLYEFGGRRVTETRPGGITRVTENYADGRIKSISGTGVQSQTFTYSIDLDAVSNELHHVTTTTTGNGPELPLWSQTATDWVGRTAYERRKGESGAEITRGLTYDARGNVFKEASTGQSPKDFTTGLVLRNGLTVLSRTVQQNPNVDGTDGTRIRVIYEYHQQIGSEWYAVQETNTSVTKTKVSGFPMGELSKTLHLDALGNQSTAVVTIDPVLVDASQGDASRIVSTVSSDGLNAAVSVTRLGLQQSVTSPSVTAPTIFGYDGHGRRISAKDARTGSTTYYYHHPTFPQHVYQIDAPGNSTSKTFYPVADRRAGQVSSETINTKRTNYDYDNQGRLTHTWGPAAYPTRNDYNGNGLRWKLHTYSTEAGWTGTIWPSGAGEGDVTIWSYIHQSTLLKAKTDASGKATTYTYWPSGHLKERIWARGGGSLRTLYTYNDAGELKKIDYSDATPDVDYSYNDKGQVDVMTDAAGTHAYEYDALGQLEQDAVAGGILGGVTLTENYTSTGRKGLLDIIGVAVNGSPVLTHDYHFSPGSGRMESVGNGTTTVTYGYTANSDWLSTATYSQGTEKLRVTRTPDSANRLQTIASTMGSQTLESQTWQYSAGRRIRSTAADLSYWNYQYNDRGEVLNGTMHSSAATAVPGYAFPYAYDAIGNRRPTPNLVSTNALNQYTKRTVPRVAKIYGSITDDVNARVTVTSPVETRIALRLGKLFYAETALSQSDPASPDPARFSTLTVAATRVSSNGQGIDQQSTEAGKYFVSANPEIYSYDDDGNMEEDGRWRYTWDAENRLIAMETIAAAAAAGLPKQRLEFAYDGRSRRVQKKVFVRDMTDTAWVVATSLKFVYDEEWNLLAELDSTNAVLRKYTWGSDFSGTRSGAGGVGGLLIQTFSGMDHAPLLDGNGSIVAIKRVSDGTEAARYIYGPFGETIGMIGQISPLNPFKFSTKYTDTETGLLYYGYRYYNTSLGRWISRDPLGERMFIQIHARTIAAWLRSQPPEITSSGKQKSTKQRTVELFYNAVPYRNGENDPIGTFDYLGLVSAKCWCCGQYWGASALSELNARGIDHDSTASNSSGGNAMRHCLAACSTAAACGVDCARDFWNGRESPGTSPGQKMDIANNNVGIGLGSQTNIPGECFDKCLQAWNTGQLTCKNGKLCPPPGSTYPHPVFENPDLTDFDLGSGP